MLRPIVTGRMPNWVDGSQKMAYQKLQNELNPSATQSPKFPMQLENGTVVVGFPSVKPFNNIYIIRGIQKIVI